LESIIENANVWLDVLDEKANVVLWNKAAEVISGYSREEVVGHGKIWEWLYPDEQYRRYLTALVAEVIQRGRVDEDFETTIRRKDGQIRIISWNERNLLDEQGKVIGSIAIGRDTTEHKRMEEELKRYSTKLEEMVVERTGKLAESEKRFRELADLLPQIVFETDEKGNLTFGNRAGFALTGHSQEDLDRGLNALELFLPEDRSRARDRISRVLSGESSAGTEYMVLRRDGSTFPVIIHTSAILSGGRAVGLRGIAIDITERKRAEEELRAAKERLDYVVASNPAVIFTGKPHSDFKDFDITYMSPNVASMLGYEPREFIDDPKFWDRHVHPEDGPRALAEIPRLFRDGHLSSDQRFMHKDGRYVWIHAEATVMRDKTGNPLEVIGYWTDVTEQKRMEEAILKSERLAAVGELATMVAHDLRNPLTGISGAAYHLKKKLGPSADQKSREMFDLIDKDVEYANKILGDLLEYSGEVRLEVSETNPGSIIAQALAKVEIPGNVRILDLAKDSPHFVADTEKMTRVFVNLIKNAVEAMPQGGELTIRSEESDGNLRLNFSDTGTGITEDAMGRIWTPFYTTKAKGMGLGLSISKRITEAHKGHISLESTVGKGTTITVSIPLGTRLGR
jgi:PAS domain S-box-containing protein